MELVGDMEQQWRWAVETPLWILSDIIYVSKSFVKGLNKMGMSAALISMVALYCFLFRLLNDGKVSIFSELLGSLEELWS